MNEDDYEFDSSETSRLSSLFGRDSESGNSSLIYKAPKQPDNFSHHARSTSSKTFHKYIELYNNGILCGKYIIAIVTSESNPSELLIYQNKKNIFIRIPICGRILYACITNYYLLLEENNRQYKLQFENDGELLDFNRVYAENGGLLELFKDSNLSHASSKNINKFHEDSSKTDSVSRESMGDIAIPRSTENEKSDILTRLEKMGLPKLLLIQNDTENIENLTIAKGNTISKINPVKNEENIKDIEVQKKNENLDSLTSGEANRPRENNSVGSELFITQDQTDLLTALLVDNKTNNSKLKEAISLLTLKLDEIIPSRQLEDSNKVKRLESRIKILELRSENLQSELKKCHDKYYEQTISKYVLGSNKNRETCENSCQTDNLGYSSEEIIQFESIVMEIMDIVKSLPLTSNTISKLMNIKDTIKNVELIPSLQSYFKFIEEKNITDDKTDEVLRSEFVAELKRIMSDMYQSIYKTEESIATKGILAMHIKHATAEILKNYDISLQQMNI